MANALFGPGGNSESFYAEGLKSTLDAPAWLVKKGLDAYEYQAGNGLTASDPTLKKIGDAARLHGIKMSLHTPYYISLSGVETEKRLKSIDYIKKSLHAASLLGADTIVIHSGSAAKISRTEAIALARDTLERAIDEVGDTSVRLGLETMGKINQLGDLNEVMSLCELDERLIPCIDFGHLNARTLGQVNNLEAFEFIINEIGNRLGEYRQKHFHSHFSKIEYTTGGEKKHLTFEDQIFGPNFEPLMDLIYKLGLEPTFICESDGTQSEDALSMKKYYLDRK